MFRRLLLSSLTVLTLLLALAEQSQAQTHAYSTRRVTLDRSRYPTERRQIESSSGSFPYLGSQFEVLAPSTPRYNCIAWSLGITSRWVWPGDSLEAFDRLNAQYGYQRLSRLDYGVQPGVEKILLYGTWEGRTFKATHQARQLRDGTWTSKLGQMPLIRHFSPDAVNGASYGRPVAVYYRRV